MAANDIFLIREFMRILNKNTADVFVNLDDKYPEKFDLFIQPLEVILAESGTRIPPNRWSYHRLVLVTSGWVNYLCGMYKFRATENTLIVIPERVIAGSEWDPETRGYFMLFNSAFFLQNHFSPRYLETKPSLFPSSQPFLRLTNEQMILVEALFATIMKERENPTPHSYQLMALKLAELLLIVEQINTEAEKMDVQHSPLDLVKRFADSVEHHFLKERSVSFYAGQLNVHPNHLNAVIKTHTGYTAKESIQNRLVLESKYLLHNTRLSIKEIAHQMGFEDPNYFGVFFKRAEHRSPAAYRSSFR